MMALSLILVPLVAAAVAFVVPSNRWRPWVLPAASLVHLILVVIVLPGPQLSALEGWLVLDAVGKVILGLIAVLFFLCAVYAPSYLALRQEKSNRVLCACLLLSLAMMTLVTLAHQFGLMWVAMEATTLTTAPCIYFSHNKRSLEATWKYLLLCSVGIALALLGSFFLAYSALHSGLHSSLFFEDLIADAPKLEKSWLYAAFVLLVAGYGAKMGLAPMHTWKPDAYGEAPGLVGALLAGGVTSCAFLAVLRFYHICSAAGDAFLARELLIFLGLLSMAIGALFMVRQRDFKRLLAYSSVEHMGILALGVGLGGPALYGALLHSINNGLTKGVLFLSAGNIHRAYGSKYTDDVRGALRVLPVSGALFLAGFFAITGAPPFGTFLSEFTIAGAALGGGRFVIGTLYLVLLAVVFLGMGLTVLRIVQGAPSAAVQPAPLFRDGVGTGLPIVVLLGLVLLLGVYVPDPVSALLRDAALFLETGR